MFRRPWQRSSSTAWPGTPRNASPTPARCGGPSSPSAETLSHQRKRRFAFAQNRFRVNVQPAADERGVQVAKIDGETGIAGLVEIGQVGMWAEEASLDGAAGDQHGGRRPVIGAAVGVLLEPAAELREDQDDDALVELAWLQTVEEPGQGFSQR